jgi:hypothetical protein
MQIDPSQPIMFDSESAPGKGTGMWQVNPFYDSDVYGGSKANGTSFERKVRFWFALTILAMFIAAIAHMMMS